MKRVLITGTAGFIGFHLSNALLKRGHLVCGYDGMTEYYDVSLKNARHDLLNSYAGFSKVEARLEDANKLYETVSYFAPDAIIHLAAQAGVRYSAENPRSYIDSNIIGTFNVLEAAKNVELQHLLIASTSSVYGANTDLPFRETDKTDAQISHYAATKKAAENMSHCYSHLYGIPVTAFRFFTVYGPWSRPDMAPIIFAKAICERKPIEVYNYGNMQRDFTYVEDVVESIRLLITCIPPQKNSGGQTVAGDSLSPVAPFRVVNIGNARPTRLLDFINNLETELGRSAICRFEEMQPGDMLSTWADTSLLAALTGYRPNTKLDLGIKRFVAWFRNYYGYFD